LRQTLRPFVQYGQTFTFIRPRSAQTRGQILWDE
jgi:hypothetical protein